MSTSQQFLTIAIPFGDGSEWCDVSDVERAIAELGNPARDDVATALRATGVIHFASIHAIAPEVDGSRAHLLIEATVDGDAEEALRAMVDAIGPSLLPILALTSGARAMGEVLPLLISHSHGISQSALRLPSNLSGLPFNGLPGLGVEAIARNRRIVEKARSIIASARDNNPAHGPQSLFRLVAQRLEADLAALPDRTPPQLAFCERNDAPWLDFARTRWTLGWILRGLWDAKALILPLLLVPYGLALAALLLTGSGALAAGWGAIVPGVILTMVIVGMLAGLLRRDELANVPVDRTPSAAALGAMMARENAPGHVQNHMISVTRLRAAWIRRLSLPLAFTAIATMARIGVMRRGFLATIGTIHAARWVVLPGTRQLVFCSNFDGSWESYLEDFITKASEGVSAVWSNARGFPATRLLFWKGAEDGDRMKRYARCSMRPTPFWFTAHPDLSATAMRKHALIVSGLLCARKLEANPSDAEAWLDLFGSIPRPDYGLQYEEIQTLLFGGLKRHPYSRVVTLNFGPPRQEADGHPYAHVQQWLAGLIARDEIAFGDKPPEQVVSNIAFSASGLRLLGLNAELAIEGEGTTQGFPAAFALGMGHQSRKRALDDPERLDWCDGDTHAVLLLYAADRTTETSLDALVARAAAAGITATRTIMTGVGTFDLESFRTAWNEGEARDPAGTASRRFVHASADSDGELSTEPFGFVDGVSQPLVRGFPGRHGAPDPVHGVEPGEFILGYADNRGYFPPSPLIERPMEQIGMHPEVLLPSPPPDQPTQYPDFAGTGPKARDFGRNGSYLVIRQLAQDVDGFEAQLDRQAEALCRQNELINPHNGNRHRTREWLAAKMLGRWRDGSALVDHPFHPAFRSGAEAIRRNGFLYKDADPQGLRCPFGAHIRRTFPRDSLAPTEPAELAVTNRHRLLRRGRPFLDPGTGVARGTLFMCFNADIERQFEFVQQTWAGSPSFHGLEGEPDPFAMHAGPSAGASQRFTIHGRNAPLTLEGLQRYVVLQGGGYFFLPGRHALWFLAGAALQRTPDGPVQPAALA